MSMSRRGYTLSVIIAVSTLSTNLPVGAVLPSPSGPGRDDSHTARSPLLVPGQFATIQAAVNAAFPGDTIQISAGTYVEQITINKDLRLLGYSADENDGREANKKTADSALTVIKAPTTLVPGSFGRAVIVDIKNGAKVTMSNLTVAGPGSGSCTSGSLFAGILVVEDATLNLSSATVTQIRDTPTADCGRSGAAIRIGERPSMSIGHATIHEVSISDYQFTGIAVLNRGSTANITDNNISGFGPLAGVNPFGITIIGAVAIVSHNKISRSFCTLPNCGPDPINQFQAVGIAVNGATAPGTVIAYNDVFDNDVGIYLINAPDCCTVDHNRLTNNRFFGLLIQDGNNAASHDRISGGEVGVGVVADTTDTVGTLRDEEIAKTTMMPVKEISCCGFRAKAIVFSAK